ncbi:hypothetical protein HDV05_002685, partial [Chytridiales sp. JEL 0842]
MGEPEDEGRKSDGTETMMSVTDSSKAETTTQLEPPLNQTPTKPIHKMDIKLMLPMAIASFVYAIFFAIGLWQSQSKYEPVEDLDFFVESMSMMYISSSMFLVIHHFVVYASAQYLKRKLVASPIKTALYSVYVFQELAAFILLMVNIVPPAVSSLVYRDEYFRLTISGVVAMTVIQVYTIITYTHEILYTGPKNMNPMLLVHRVTIIGLETFVLSIVVLSDDFMLRIFVFVVGQLLIAST